MSFTARQDIRYELATNATIPVTICRDLCLCKYRNVDCANLKPISWQIKQFTANFPPPPPPPPALWSVCKIDCLMCRSNNYSSTVSVAILYMMPRKSRAMKPGTYVIHCVKMLWGDMKQCTGIWKFQLR